MPGKQGKMTKTDDLPQKTRHRVQLGVKEQCPACDGMGQFQCGSAKQLGGKLPRLRKLPGGFGAVLRVTQDGKAHVGAVESQLMGPAGDGVESKLGTAIQPGKHTVLGHRGLAVRADLPQQTGQGLSLREPLSRPVLQHSEQREPRSRPLRQLRKGIKQ